MKAFQIASILLFTLAAASAEGSYDVELNEYQDARFFVANFTSSLIQVNATILAYGLIIIAIVGAAAVAISYLFLESANSSGSSSYGNYNYYNARSANYGYNGFDILKWISMAQDAYEGFDVNNIECQKKLICELMKEPDYYGAMARKVKTGFEYGAPYLELFGISDDMRELLDEWLDANARSNQDKQCSDYFQCDFSLKNTVEKNLGAGNHL